MKIIEAADYFYKLAYTEHATRLAQQALLNGDLQAVDVLVDLLLENGSIPLLLDELAALKYLVNTANLNNSPFVVNDYLIKVFTDKDAKFIFGNFYRGEVDKMEIVTISIKPNNLPYGVTCEIFYYPADNSWRALAHRQFDQQNPDRAQFRDEFTDTWFIDSDSLEESLRIMMKGQPVDVISRTQVENFVNQAKKYMKQIQSRYAPIAFRFYNQVKKSNNLAEK